MPDLTPLEYAGIVVVGYFLVVFIVLSFIPGASVDEIGKRS